MKIVVYGNKFNKEASPYVEELFNLLIEKGVQISVNKSLFEFTKQFFLFNEKVIVKNKKSLLEVDTDFLISVGGDGTILDTITTVRDSNVPILGVNTGRLGFLANNTKDEIVSSVNNKEYFVRNLPDKNIAADKLANLGDSLLNMINSLDDNNKLEICKYYKNTVFN